MKETTSYSQHLQNFPQFNVWYTAKQVNLSASTLRAMERRNLVEINNTCSPHLYKAISQQENNTNHTIYSAILNLAKNGFIVLKRTDEKIGMLCQIKGGLIYDCWNKPYTNLSKVKFYLNRGAWQELNWLN